MASSHIRKEAKDGITIKLHRGEHMCLVGFNLEGEKATNEFVGFSLEFQEPGSDQWKRVWNRLQFSYDRLSEEEKRKGAPSTLAPIQKFRWLHFPHETMDGEYRYRATAKYMRPDGSIVSGSQVETAMDLGGETVPGFLDVGFTRGYASSQAYANRERFPCQERILPPHGTAAPGDLSHDMASCETEYSWLGFKGRKAIYAMLDEAIQDASITVDAILYEFREPEVVNKLHTLGRRLRIIVDDHDDIGAPDSNETVACQRLTASGAQVKRGHFARQQHNKVLVLRRNGAAFKALAGSTNMSLRGLYVQSNNTLVFTDASIARFFADIFDSYFSVIDQARSAPTFRKDRLSLQWHDFNLPIGSAAKIAVSPHADEALSLTPIADAIEQAHSSVFYALAFLNQISGGVRDALDQLMDRSTFSYGISQRKGGLAVSKPDGSRGLVSFAYLAKDAPEPFSSEWSSYAEANSPSNVLHHKFVVTDFNTPRAKVFTGSSNMAAGGEKENGDHVIMIEDGRIATAYAVEALRTFDHFHFRVAMREADQKKEVLNLAKPPEAGKKTWFKESYVSGHIKERDRVLFGN